MARTLMDCDVGRNFLGLGGFGGGWEVRVEVEVEVEVIVDAGFMWRGSDVEVE